MYHPDFCHHHNFVVDNGFAVCEFHCDGKSSVGKSFAHHDHDLDPDRLSISKPKLMKDLLQVKIRIREKYVVQITPAFKV